MGTPYLGELKLISWNFPPKNWAFCNGQLLPINQNQPLFSILGTTYGGNGQTTFALPDLRGRVPIHMGAGFTLGQRAGEETHTLSLAELAPHTHPVTASAANGSTVLPGGNFLAQATGGYGGPIDLTTLEPSSVSNVGGSQPHENRQPFLVLNVIIALIGAFPSQN